MMLEAIAKVLREGWAPMAVEDLAARFGVGIHDATFRLTLDKAIERHRDETGRQYRVRKGQLVVCTASELAKLARSKAKALVRKERRALTRAVLVEISQLPEGEREGHRRFVDKRLRMMALRELAASYRDPFEAVAEAMGKDARKAIEERSMRSASIRRLSEVAMAHGGDQAKA